MPIVTVPPVEVPFDDHKDESIQLQMDAATLNQILSNVGTDPLVVPNPLTGTPFQIVPNKREALRALLQANPLVPYCSVRFQVDGNCEDFDAITIEALNPHPTGTYGANVTAFGMGLVMEMACEVSAKRIRTEPCNEDGGRRKVRKFHITWYPKIAITPGISTAFGIVAEYVVPVRTPCCEEEKGSW